VHARDVRRLLFVLIGDVRGQRPLLNKDSYRQLQQFNVRFIHDDGCALLHEVDKDRQAVL
jgi:hypothetical protein